MALYEKNFPAMEEIQKSSRRNKTQKKSKLSKAGMKIRNKKGTGGGEGILLSVLPCVQQSTCSHTTPALEAVAEIFAKRWTFSNNPRPPFLANSWIDFKRGMDAEGIGAEGTGADLFSQDYEDSEALCSLDKVGKICQEACLEDLRSGAGASGSQRAAWLDSRDFLDASVGGVARQYRNPLTPTALYNLLKGDLTGEKRAQRVLM